MSDAAQLEQRVLLRMTTARDAAMTCGVLARAGIPSLACSSIRQLVDELGRGAGALLIAEEAFETAQQKVLAAALAAQPPWSDVAVLLLARQGALSEAIVQVMDRLPNVTCVERPVRVASLLSAVRSTLRARQRQYEVRALLEDLRRVDQRRTEFLATLAHELRNPLAPIRTTLALLASGKLDATATDRCHGLMRRQVDHMVRLVNDLMEVSRITRGKVDLQFVPVLLDAALNDAIEQTRPLIEAAGHVLLVDVGRDSLLVNGDAIRLTQVFSNLLNNATKYTPPNGRIRIAARREGGEAVVEVQDSGLGIAPDMLQAIFEMFVQVGETAKAAQGGLGIGLTLVQTLVELHGGSVVATSPGLHRGSTFTVRLPLAVEASGLLAGGPADRDWSSASVERSVLVVDDNRDAADSLTELLRVMGATALTAYSGEQALRIAADQRLDAAVLDIGMPGMDGFDLAQRLRRLPGGEAMSLIALTGWGQDRDRQRLAAAGFDHHLLKPVDADRLAALLCAAGRPRSGSTEPG